MRQRHLMVGAAVAALATTLVVTSTGPTVAGPTASAPAADGPGSYVVLLEEGASTAVAATRLRAQGATVTSVDRSVGLLTVSTKRSGFRAAATALPGVEGVAADVSIGSVPRLTRRTVEGEGVAAARQRLAKQASSRRQGAARSGPRRADPLDRQLWGMTKIRARAAHRVETGSKRVRVGVIDTGIQGNHPDLARNFDRRLSRNFVTDIPEIDGPCEHAGCQDPAGEDDDGHGTHVAGTMAASLDRFGLSGVAPNVDLINIRAGQDSGYFFLGPTVRALTYAGRKGVDVVNMSFYVDPWLYNCDGGAPEDSPAEAADQAVIIRAMNRALVFARAHQVTLVSALGNEHSDLAHPPVDLTSPDYGATPHPRTIDNAACVSLPTEGPGVIGVSSVGPSGRKADYSNWSTTPASGEIEVAAPGGWFRDGLGTAAYRTNGNLILSTYPRGAATAAGFVDADGVITDLGHEAGVQKRCRARSVAGSTRCGYYAALQGTSMASPHAAGVAALIVAAHGHRLRGGGFGLAPARVGRILQRSATDHACPAGGVQSYTDVDRDDSYTATCVGTRARNGFYGGGIVNAFRAVTWRR